MIDKIEVVSQEGCGHCDTVKEYLKWKKKPYKEILIEHDISVEEFWEKYADQAADGTPIVFVNGVYIFDVISYYESGLEL